ncbi:MAG: NAD(P)-dependent dehydrogenase (short-subunit alcohol dehydrogenase family) [Cocleimonas sp.]
MTEVNANPLSLSGKVALITGATSGIGAQQARALSSAGASVVLVGRREDRLKELAEEIRDSGGEADYLGADLSDESHWQLVVDASLSFFGRVDILCNTAGVNLRQHADDVTPESWDLTLGLNLKVPFFLAQKLIPNMRERGWGKIINVASLQSERAFANGIAYGASKGGITQLTRAMAEAWSKDGVSCNAIAPGFFPTELTAPVFDNDEASSKFANQTAIGRNGELSDLDGICVFLSSHASDYITGQTIYIDGGFTAK